MILEAPAEDVVEYLVESCRVEGSYLGCVHVDVILEVLSEQARLVPRQATFAGLQEEACALNRPEAEDEELCAEEGLDATERSAADCGRAVSLEDDFDYVGVEPQGELLLLFERSAMQAGK